MHNCKATKETLVALAMIEAQSQQTQPLPAEAAKCAACLEEYASLLNTVRVADQVKDSALPGDDFWPGYQARLRQNLVSASSGVPARALESRTSRTRRLRDLLTSSVRVPLPMAAVLLLILAVSFAFAINSRRQVKAAAPIVLTRTIEVPAPREKPVEKVVTRIVYRERERRRPLSAGTTIAAQHNALAAEIPINLIGFKPANEVKLTIIKGSTRDEK
jgi:hypothetical protein